MVRTAGFLKVPEAAKSAVRKPVKRPNQMTDAKAAPEWTPPYS